MRAVAALLAIALSAGVGILPAIAQTSQDVPHLTPRATAVPEAQAQAQPNSPAAPDIMVPAGTKIPLTLKQGINSKSARPGDPVYAQTAFPITQNNQIVIPAGTFVQGEVLRVVRPGHVKGRAQLQMSFTSMIFPNGYTIMLPGAVQNTPGSKDNIVSDKEGTIQGPGGKGKDAGTLATTTVAGAGIGAWASGAKGAAIGAATGGVIGLATVLLTRGPEVQLGTGDSVEMVLESSLDLNSAKMHNAASAQ
ncbi:MAG: TrbI/VirB10 family protein [Candidatus Korobacteraceae bacterium]